jgi:MFS family permease
MLNRFRWYGFLKNQQYYEYFLILAFLQMGLSYFAIGLLLAFREVMILVLEVPTGAVADLFGRRRSMILSFLSYIGSFVVFGIAGNAAIRGRIQGETLMGFLLLAMACFALGETFRTGTHKAMIFHWLSLQGRTAETTRVYGDTRSWSKIGSAVSVVLASLCVFGLSNYIDVFYFAVLPYILNIFNLLGYPKELDGSLGRGVSVREVFHHVKRSVALSFRQAGLRGLLLESMGFEGLFKASKDYFQPILKAAAIPLTAVMFTGLDLSEEQQSVVLIGPVFFVLFLVSAAASRNAHRLVGEPGMEDRAARRIWAATAFLFLSLVPSAWFGFHGIMIGVFAALYVAQNFWRPILISRVHAHCEASQGATVLSIESQSRSLSTMVLAPLLGLAVDAAQHQGMGVSAFWPIGLVGGILALVFVCVSGRVGAGKGQTPECDPTG